MIYLIIIFILWNWGLTPLWVNVLCTIFAVFGFLDELDRVKSNNDE